MNADAVLVVGGVAGTLSRVLFNAGLSGKWSAWAAFVAASVVVAIWAYSHGDFSRATSWDYFAGWVSVLLTALGSFHAIEQAPGAVKGTANAVRSMTGGTGE